MDGWYSSIREAFVDGKFVDGSSRRLNMPLVTDATGNDLTYKLIGLAMEVHNEIGHGFKEEVYEKAFEVKLNHAGIEPFRQFEVFVDFEGERVATFYLDLFPNQKVIVEIKAFSHQLTNDELAQVINYLKATGASVGLLFNFGRRRLEYRRVFPGKDMKPVQRIGRDNAIKK
jgi:GxxExxY protein